MKKFYIMKRSQKMLLAISAVMLVGVIVWLKRKKNTQKLSEASDKGYETAQDVLYPRLRTRYRKLHYGPVLPAL